MRISDLIYLGKDAAIFAVSIVVVIMFVWCFGYKIIYKRVMHGEKNLSVKRVVLSGSLMAVMLIIIYATLFRGGFSYRKLSIIPFSSYKLAWFRFASVEWRNIILNICMFIPFGFLLPIVSRRFRKAWKTYLAGFAFTFLIELFQIILKRGIFETDDLINNFLGTMIGYGLAKIVLAVSDRKTFKKKEIIKVLLLQLPLVLTAAIFGIIFTSYYCKDYGNMVYENVSTHKMPEVYCSSDIKLSDETVSCDIYKTKIADVEETKKFAEEFFARQGKTMDEKRTDIYDDTACYYTDDNSISLWIDYKGFKVWYTNYDMRYTKSGERCGSLAGAKENQVREAVNKLGFAIPNEAVFREEADGNYTFNVTGEITDGNYCTGKASCSLNEQGDVVQIHYDIVRGEICDKVSVISSQEAYDILCSGKFYYAESEIPADLPLMVTSLNLIYLPDSKGFYRPVYCFTLKDDEGSELQIHISDVIAGRD